VDNARGQRWGATSLHQPGWRVIAESLMMASGVGPVHLSSLQLAAFRRFRLARLSASAPLCLPNSIVCRTASSLTLSLVSRHHLVWVNPPTL
jgi:hypothetical protein